MSIMGTKEDAQLALAILKHTKTTSETFAIKDLLLKAGGTESNEIEMALLSGELLANKNESRAENELNNQPVEVLSSASPTTIGASSLRCLVPSSSNQVRASLQELLVLLTKIKHEVEDVVAQKENQNPPLESVVRANSSPTTLQQHKILSRRNMKDLRVLHKTQQNMQYEMYIEALQNARNTIILVAILIATVTFTAGISPPGGVCQDGPLKGKSTVGRTTAFKIFTISNYTALFTSLCLVIVLVSIIPFERKLLGRLLVVSHKIMWVAVSFMATAYVAATWVILPHGSQGEDWTFEALLAISCGSMGAVLLYLGVVLTRHWLRKLKWRRERLSKVDANGEHKENSLPSLSVNSDVDSAKNLGLGYHVY